ncbi:hypothetical protein P152DRAFT_511114 [Eremomyces bilateralis CBS 781.70]|uniref:Tetratricopeptide SHNi-TPR domain-containing protein n=1 Tax=Eremomyces bilateralis CBS 781.70 TaxID=1392243 RepID=A0A6G1GEH9_9PEZI|nr:uncharacterized protein P152DRAFT_511114 [Eremomyces bilateralis CBS 781.70]KAF1816316.1 hypothetical protein P152DRAFT_511114 [Eremomyces bilateralis CBS 781.70]
MIKPEEAAAPPPADLVGEANGENTDELPPSAEKLSELITSANLYYTLKNYPAAADIYSDATEMQAALHGEMNPSNADLLFRYGRCLYKVAVEKNDVLGGKVAADKPAKKKGAKQNRESNNAGEGSSSSSALPVKGGEETAANKPFFEITGDENWDTSDDEEDEEGQDQAAQEEEDDLANAYEILDLARVLLERRLTELSSEDATTGGQDKDKSIHDTKELLADTRDYQAEISLENERFADAVADSAQALDLKLQLYPAESEILAEAHFKYSLALEFASVSSVRQAQEEAEQGNRSAESMAEAKVDETMRKQAAGEMEKAIASCHLRVAKEEAAVKAMEDGEGRTAKLKTIADVKEMVGDMEQRLQDLNAPFQPPEMTIADAQTEALQGLLGTLTGADAFQQQATIAEATKNATDISGLIRTRKKEKAPVPETNGKGKRKLEEDEASEGSKKAKVEDAPE